MWGTKQRQSTRSNHCHYSSINSQVCWIYLRLWRVWIQELYSSINSRVCWIYLRLHVWIQELYSSINSQVCWIYLINWRVWTQELYSSINSQVCWIYLRLWQIVIVVLTHEFVEYIWDFDAFEFGNRWWDRLFRLRDDPWRNHHLCKVIFLLQWGKLLQGPEIE